MDGVKQQDSTPQKRDRKLLGILKKDRTWFKYELHCNVKTLVCFFTLLPVIKLIKDHWHG
jgi:hypothetical protein